MIGILGIVVALGLLMYLAFRGLSVLILGPVMALVAVLIAGGLPILGAYTQIFMQNTGNFIILVFPLFMLGAIFGKLMDDSGSALSIARSGMPILRSSASKRGSSRIGSKWGTKVKWSICGTRFS